MTMSQLIIACDNISLNTELKVFDSVWDFDNLTTNYKIYTASSLINNTTTIARFYIYSNFVALALA